MFLSKQRLDGTVDIVVACKIVPYDYTYLTVRCLQLARLVVRFQ